VNEKVYLILLERSGDLILPYLDKYDLQIISRVSTAWNSNVASYNLFSTIVRSIKEVVQEEYKTSSSSSSNQISKLNQISP
jgi:hypothetical protein